MLNFLKSLTKKTNGTSDKDDPSSTFELDIPTKLSKELFIIIQNVLNLSDTTVKEIMVPRLDVVTIKSDEDIKNIVSIADSSGHSRIPVYENSVDNIIGMLYVKDLLKYVVIADKDFNLKDIIRPVLFVPESKKIESMFKEFKEKSTHISIVVDEYGGFAGVVTLEDILEEIVGDIQDEFDNEEEEICKLNNNKYLIDTRIYLDELNHEIGTNLNSDKADTLGGYVFNLFGKIPKSKEYIVENDITFHIEKVNGNRIERILIEFDNKKEAEKIK